MNLLQRFVVWLARVAAVEVGREGEGRGDGLLPARTAGTELDKSWPALQQELAGALGAWRENPLARRVIGLVTAYVVGDGIRLASDYGPLSRFLERFAAHPQNHLLLRQPAWCDELARAGELFVTLHTNPADGMSYARALPAACIDRVEWRPGDYEAELRFHEEVDREDPDYANGGRWWLNPEHPDADRVDADQVGAAGRPGPVMLHFAVNRPVGCVRGESDLAPALPWLKRYSRWLEDRARLNSALRAFVWVVKVPGRLVREKMEQYRQPPEPGSVIVADKDGDDWQALAPPVHAADAEADGRALRWMVVAAGPGIGLSDLGEADTSNLATARAMGELRVRFMAARQAYFGWALARVAVAAYNRAVRLGRVRGRECDTAAVRVGLPDISPADNADLGAAAQAVAGALAQVGAAGVGGTAFRRLMLRTVLKFAGEALSDRELETIAGGGE